jgi:hypothetical protein
MLCGLFTWLVSVREHNDSSNFLWQIECSQAGYRKSSPGGSSDRRHRRQARFDTLTDHHFIGVRR